MNQHPNRYRLFLIGFMGVGKTSLGRGLAEQLGLPFYDLDEFIETRAGSSISEIFAAKGEAGFRELETEVLAELSVRPPGIIATGGGTFTRPENRELIRQTGVSIWLDAPEEVLIARGGRGRHRPLWGGPEKARALLESRLVDYQRADMRFDLGHDTVPKAVERLASVLGLKREPA